MLLLLPGCDRFTGHICCVCSQLSLRHKHILADKAHTCTKSAPYDANAPQPRAALGAMGNNLFLSCIRAIVLAPAAAHSGWLELMVDMFLTRAAAVVKCFCARLATTIERKAR